MAGYPTTSSKVDGTVSTKNKKHKSQAMRDFEIQAMFTTAVMIGLYIVTLLAIVGFDFKMSFWTVITYLAALTPVVFIIMRYIFKVNAGMIKYTGTTSEDFEVKTEYSSIEISHEESFPAANGGSGLMETEIGWYRNP